MINPTEQDIAAARSLAAERFGVASIREFVATMPDGDEVKLLVQEHNAKTYGAFHDGKRIHLMDAISVVWADHVLWPGEEELDKIVEDWPAIKALVADNLATVAGSTTNVAITDRLKPSGLPAIGLSTSASKELLGAHPDAKLWTVRLDGVGEDAASVGVVMRSPDPARFTAANDARREAELARKGVIASVRDFVTEQVVWCREPVANLFARYPAVVDDFWTAFQIVGGATARARSKRL